MEMPFTEIVVVLSLPEAIEPWLQSICPPVKPHSPFSGV